LDSFFAFIKKPYTNIWIRNGFLLFILIFFNVVTNYVQPPLERDNPLSIAIVLTLSFLFMFFHSHVLLRCYLFRRKYFSYLIFFVVFIVFATFISVYFFPWLLNDSPEKNVLDISISILFNIFLGSIIYFLHYFFLKYINVTEIKILNQKTEIENLKQQLNPHFLLNSLNNLYGVSLVNPADVPNKIIELSDLLKYQIETSKKNYSSLEEEKYFIDKYIQYSKWKLQNIRINSSETGELKNYRITPMLFLPLVENAIKYTNFDHNPIIDIHWEFKSNRIIFTITNMYKDNQSEIFSTKTGIKNLRKRLELFHPESNLVIEDNNSIFKVKMELWNLSIHV
jgi:two-component system, LytTR family, sensor kinase